MAETSRSLTESVITQGETPIIFTPERTAQEIANIDLSYNITRIHPNHEHSLPEEKAHITPTITGIVRGITDGTIDPDRAIDILSKLHAMAVEGGKIDPLSGELKKPDFINSLQTEIEIVSRPHREGETVDKLTHTIDVFFLDLVNFKNVNDGTDQATGDRVIQAAVRKFRELFPTSADFAAGRVGDEIVFYGPRPKKQKNANEILDRDPTEPPPALMTVQTRKGPVTVYYHIGKATYDPQRHTDEVIEEDGHKRFIRGAEKLWNEAEGATNTRKLANQANFPELYLKRQTIAEPVTAAAK